MGFFRDIKYEVKWMVEEIFLICKHPTRKASWQDLSYHWSKLWDHIIFHPWYCLKRGLRNIWVWGPTMWGIDSWDHFFLLDIMDKQLKEMEDLWRTKYVVYEREYEASGDGMEKGWRCQHRKIWKRIRWTRKLMEMWRNEHYAMKWYDYHHTKFPERSFLEHEESETKYDEYGVPISYTCKQMAEDERIHYREGSEKARLMDEKTFKLWQKNLGFVRNWWH